MLLHIKKLFMKHMFCFRILRKYFTKVGSISIVYFLNKFNYFHRNLYLNGVRNVNEMKTTSSELTNEVMKSTRDLHYRIILVENLQGRVSWRNYTGIFVNKGDVICDIIQEDNTVKQIISPTRGYIANRFIDEGAFVTENSLVCLLKVSEKPKLELDREAIARERKLFQEIDEVNIDESTETEHYMTPLKPAKVKDFIPLREDQEYIEPKIDTLDELSEDKKRIILEKVKGIILKRRHERFKQFTSAYNEKEIVKRVLIDEGGLVYSSTSEDVQIDKEPIDKKLYQEIIHENFLSKIDRRLYLLNTSANNQFLTAIANINMRNVIKFALKETERNKLKFEIKCLILIAAIHTLKEMSYLIKDNNSNEINITVGIAAGGKLAFPLLRNVAKLSYIDLKYRLNSIEKMIIEGMHIDEIRAERHSDESLVVTNDWDYGSTEGGSCLYVSNAATLALNNIVMKPVGMTTHNEINFQPTMCTGLTFNNTKIPGQDALLFINKLKITLETIHHVTNSE